MGTVFITFALRAKSTVTRLQRCDSWAFWLLFSPHSNFHLDQCPHELVPLEELQLHQNLTLAMILSREPSISDTVSCRSVSCSRSESCGVMSTTMDSWLWNSDGRVGTDTSAPLSHCVNSNSFLESASTETNRRLGRSNRHRTALDPLLLPSLESSHVGRVFLQAG